MRYAIITCASHNYLLGLHAMLGGIEYYGNEVDVHVGSNSTLSSYFDYVKDKYSFKIFYHDVGKLCGHEGYEDSDFIYGKYAIANLIKNDYDAVLHIDSDCMITSDITPYLEIAAKTGMILVPKNPQSPMRLEDLDTSDHEYVAQCLPIKNYLWFYDAKVHTDLLDFLWESRNDKRLLENSGLDPYFFVKKIHELSKKVLILPGSLWLADDYTHKGVTDIQNRGKMKLVNPFGDQLMVVHCRPWNTSMNACTLDAVKETSFYDITTAVIKNNLAMYDFLANYKVKLQEIRNIDPFYDSLLNNFARIV